jgi:hypothetical protein
MMPTTANRRPAGAISRPSPGKGSGMGEAGRMGQRRGLTIPLAPVCASVYSA